MPFEDFKLGYMTVTIGVETGIVKMSPKESFQSTKELSSIKVESYFGVVIGWQISLSVLFEVLSRPLNDVRGIRIMIGGMYCSAEKLIKEQSTAMYSNGTAEVSFLCSPK